MNIVSFMVKNVFTTEADKKLTMRSPEKRLFPELRGDAEERSMHERSSFLQCGNDSSDAVHGAVEPTVRPVEFRPTPRPHA
jgi:hypothetical protein